MELVADSKNLRKTLGWQPQRSGIQEIVRDAWAYYQSKFNEKRADDGVGYKP
jgi:UDP-glucose 4-epimerase